MPPQGRLGDLSMVPADSHGCPACPHPAVGPAVSGSGDVNVNSMPALRVSDTGVHAACCGPNTWTAQIGSPTVFINGRKAHRMLDVDSHCGGKGMLITGSPNVIVGGGYDIGGLALGMLSEAASGLVAQQLAGPLASVSEALSQHVGPIVTQAVTGAIQGAVQGAVAGAIAGAANGPQGILQGALGGAASGAVAGAVAGAMNGLREELGKTLADARADVEGDIAKMGDAEFQQKKDALFNDPQLAEARAAERAAVGDYYGSELHQKYGATVEYMTGGRITAAEAMQLNPSGGITGPGANGLRIESGPISTHAVRHDAQGFLYNNFDGTGPGYGGLVPSSPLSGQVVGVLRELVNPTELPTTTAKP